MDLQSMKLRNKEEAFKIRTSLVYDIVGSSPYSLSASYIAKLIPLVQSTKLCSDTIVRFLNYTWRTLYMFYVFRVFLKRLYTRASKILQMEIRERNKIQQNEVRIKIIVALRRAHIIYFFPHEKELYNLSYADLCCSSLFDCTNNLILKERDFYPLDIPALLNMMDVLFRTFDM